ncbi:MAG: CoB--CoM heterodisulfide reductase iron-sulfur subunit A family protein [Desulfobacterales bacterium]
MSDPSRMNDENRPAAGTHKVGVYICHCGGNISDHVDVEAVRERVEKLPGVSVARTNTFMCSDPGQEMIMDDLKSGAVDRVVVASCAPSLHETTFRSAILRAGGNPYIYEHANIREQVSWVHHGDMATDKATRLVSAAAAKAELLEPLEPIRVEACRHATVIGGGIAGLRAAKDMAERGIDVALIEKTAFLGGRLARLEHVAPTGEKAEALIRELGSAVLADDRITVHTCSEVTAFEGYVGNFKLRIQKRPPGPPEPEAPAGLRAGDYVPFSGLFASPAPTNTDDLTIETGVIVLATGFESYTPRNGEYGFGRFENVVTLPEVIRRLAEASGTGDRLVMNGREIRSIAMIHCVGSRQIPGIHPEDEPGSLNEYCSRTCCTAVLDTAATIRERHPGTRVYDFYRDIRTYGRGHEEIYHQASQKGVIFLRFDAEEAPTVSAGGAGSRFPLTVRVKDTLTFGEEVRVPVDLVVLATGMEPTGIRPLVEMMKLPVGADRFLLEVHPKLRPVELPQAGFLLAGTCQAPMDVGEACNAAGGAAVKASALLGRGFVELDPFVAQVDVDRCRGTGSCVEACPAEGALRMIEAESAGRRVQRAQVTPALCTGCGACVAVCPENAIDVNGWTLKQYEAMVDAIVAA